MKCVDCGLDLNSLPVGAPVFFVALHAARCEGCQLKLGLSFDPEPYSDSPPWPPFPLELTPAGSTAGLSASQLEIRAIGERHVAALLASRRLNG